MAALIEITDLSKSYWRDSFEIPVLNNIGQDHPAEPYRRDRQTDQGKNHCRWNRYFGAGRIRARQVAFGKCWFCISVL